MWCGVMVICWFVYFYGVAVDRGRPQQHCHEGLLYGVWRLGVLLVGVVKP